MNGRSDYEEILAGMDVYQAFTCRTAEVFGQAPLIAGGAVILEGAIHTSPQLSRLGYTLGKLCGEAGEALEHFWKYMRDTEAGDVLVNADGSLRIPEELVGKITKEMGDALWYVSQVLETMGVNMGSAAIGNLEKLRSRSERGVLKGSGDDR